MDQEFTVEFYDEVENGVWLRLGSDYRGKHVCISCRLSEVAEIDTALKLVCEKVRDGFSYQGLITLPPEFQEIWLLKPVP